MLKRFLKRLTHNLGLKILAFIFAVAIWLLVVNVEDPDITRSYTVPVTMENAEILTDAGKMYEVVNDSDTVRITVTAHRRIIENLSSSDFTAVADFQDLTEDQMSGQQQLQVYITMLRYGNQVSISSIKKYVTVNIEDIQTKNLTVNVNLTGSAASGYTAGLVRALPTSVSVTGPSSVVSQITSAVATADISGMTSDLVTTGSIHYYNDNGEEVSTEKLTNYTDTAEIQVGCNAVKELDIHVTASGTPETGYEVTEISTDVEKVKVEGPESVVSGMDSVSISGDAVSVEDLTEGYSTSLYLPNYLPSGVELADGQKKYVNVTVTINPYEEKTISFSTDRISIAGLDSSMNAEFADSEISIPVYCESSKAQNLSEADISVVADLSDAEEGTNKVTLQVILPDGVLQAEKVTAEVDVSAAASDGT